MKQENPLRPFDCFLGEGQLHESCDWRGKCHCRLIGQSGRWCPQWKMAGSECRPAIAIL